MKSLVLPIHISVITFVELQGISTKFQEYLRYCIERVTGHIFHQTELTILEKQLGIRTVGDLVSTILMWGFFEGPARSFYFRYPRSWTKVPLVLLNE